MKNEKLIKIEKGEIQINLLVGNEAKTRREFAKDGIDATEQKQLDSILGKIKKLKGVIKKTRADIETNKAAWDGRKTEYRSDQLMIGDLRAWPDPSTPTLIAQYEKIEACVADQRWKDASGGLDRLSAVIQPIFAAYELQFAARTEFFLLAPRYIGAMTGLKVAAPITDDIRSRIGDVESEFSVAEDTAIKLDYVTALQALQSIMPEINIINEEIRTLHAKKAEFDAIWATLAPKLQDNAQCEFADLLDMQVEIIALQEQISTLTVPHDYAAAIPLAADLLTKVNAYLAAYAKAVDARTLYVSRLPRIDGELGDASVSEFPALEKLQLQISKAGDAMKGFAGADEYEKALLEMDKLVPLLDDYRAKLDNARLGRAFDLLYAQMESQFADVAVCNYGPLEALSLEIDGDRTAAENAASAGKYADGIANLTGAAAKLVTYAVKLAALETAKLEYDGKLAHVLSRFDAIAQCEFSELDEDHKNIIKLRTEMESLATKGDYPNALMTLIELERCIFSIEASLDELIAARAEYDGRLSGLLSRYDSLMLSDFTELEDERRELKTLRTDMEASATSTKYRQALIAMNQIEVLLNDLDAQRGNLIDIQSQYLATYNALKANLAKVEGCTHPELKIKKDPIITLRDEMKAAADTTDFLTALSKARELIAPIILFLILEELLKKYTQSLTAVEGRLETARAFRYKSLADDQVEIEKQCEKMKALAAEAKLAEALVEMVKLENLISAIIALNADLIKKEDVYKKLRDDLKPQVDIIRSGKFDAANEAHKKIIEARSKILATEEKMIQLGGEHEFHKAIEQADLLNKTLIPSYLKLVDENSSEEEAYRIYKEMAESDYKKAKEKAAEYSKDLADPFKILTPIFDAMIDAGEENFSEGTAKAKALINAVKTFDIKWENAVKREAEFKANSKTAINRFNNLPPKAEKKAEREYGAADDLISEMNTAATEKDFKLAETKLSELLTKLDEIDEALKTQGEHKAEYNGLISSLGQRVENAEKSKYKDGKLEDGSNLTDPIKVAVDAFAAMKDRGDNKDYETGVDLSEDVESALTAFDKIEDKFEQADVRFQERMSGLRNQYDQAATVTKKSLISRVSVLTGLHEKAAVAAAKYDFEKALPTAAKLKTEAESILAEAERLEDEKGNDDDDGPYEGIGKVLDDGLDAVLGRAKDAIVDTALDILPEDIKTGIETVENVYDELAEGDPIDALYEGGKGIAKVHPVTKRAVKVAEEVYDGVEKTIDAAKDIKEFFDDDD